MSNENQTPAELSLPKPDAILVPKGDVMIPIDYRKKKSGKGQGQFVPFLDKAISFTDLLVAVGEEFAASCIRTRYNAALQDWAEDVVKKKGQFILEEFTKRIQLGKLVRLKIAEINESLEEIDVQFQQLTAAIEANGGIATEDGQAANKDNMLKVMGLIAEQTRLNALKVAQKRAKKAADDDEDDE